MTPAQLVEIKAHLAKAQGPHAQTVDLRKLHRWLEELLTAEEHHTAQIAASNSLNQGAMEDLVNLRSLLHAKHLSLVAEMKHSMQQAERIAELEQQLVAWANKYNVERDAVLLQADTLEQADALLATADRTLKDYSDRLAAMREACTFKRNVIIADNDGSTIRGTTLLGEWVCIPREDFDKAQQALAQDGSKEL